jgi:hypothetical protein
MMNTAQILRTTFGHLWRLLILHNIEIFVDSMVYALALTLLLVRGGEAKADELFARFLLCLEQTAVEK